MSPNDILNGGTDISNHYLKGHQQYKIIRYKNDVYAVNLQANDFVHLWKSNKGINQVVQRKLGQGAGGVVYKKTEDKARKKRNRYIYNETDNESKIKAKSDKNIKILDQRFMLKKKGLDSIFTFGLHSIKNSTDDLFYMPIVKKYKPSIEEETAMFVDFVFKLKQVNDMGMAHDDYCGSVNCSNINLGNEMTTQEGIVLIDIDEGLYEIKENDQSKFRGLNSRMRDQWLLLYIGRTDPVKLDALERWYQGNDYCPISESPEQLRQFIQQNDIRLPVNIQQDLTQGMDQCIAASSSGSGAVIPSAVEKPSVPVARKGIDRQRAVRQLTVLKDMDLKPEDILEMRKKLKDIREGKENLEKPEDHVRPK